MRSKENKGRPYLLVLTAVIWGFAFVAQSKGGDALGPFTFSVIRNIVGAIVLLPVIAFLDRKNGGANKPKTKEERKKLIVGGVLCGFILCAGSNLQQAAFALGSSAGNAGFLTACYIVLVPIAGIFFKRKCGINVWISVLIALTGLYFLCIKGPFVIAPPDICLLFGALSFTFHIIVIDHFSPYVDGVRMSAIQFIVCGILSIPLMLIFDYNKFGITFAGTIEALKTSEALLPLLYASVMSSGVAYTLQIVGQKNVNPSVASLLMSLESVFSVVGGWIILKEKMSGRELGGCALIFVAVILAQIDFKKKNNS